MVEKFTVAELAKELDVSTTAIYKKVDKKQFETVQEKIGSREITFILLDNDQLAKIKAEINSNKVGFKQLNEQLETNTQKFNEVKSQPEQNNLTEKVIELAQTISNQFETHSKQLVEYAEKAGKYELLEDKQKELKDDVSHWQEEYFKIKYEKELLTKRNKKHIIFYSILGIALISLLGGLIFELTRPPKIKEKIVQVVKLKPVPANMMKYYKNK